MIFLSIVKPANLILLNDSCQKEIRRIILQVDFLQVSLFSTPQVFKSSVIFSNIILNGRVEFTEIIDRTLFLTGGSIRSRGHR